LPNSPIAQGSIFIVFGQNLGPASIAQANKFPLPSSQGLAGTSIKVTVGGTTLDAIMLYTLATRSSEGISVIHDRNPIFVRPVSAGR